MRGIITVFTVICFAAAVFIVRWVYQFDWRSALILGGFTAAFYCGTVSILALLMRKGA